MNATRTATRSRTPRFRRGGRRGGGQSTTRLGSFITCLSPDAIMRNRSHMSLVRLHKTVGVKVGGSHGVAVVQVGGGAPIVVQSMTMTDTADARGTAQQCVELAEAGSDMVRITVNVAEAAAVVPEIKRRVLDAGCTGPLIAAFPYTVHLRLSELPECAAARGKRRINP